jgi:cell division protein FtsL
MIEEIIHKNIDSFFNEELNAGHLGRFEKRLNREFAKSQNSSTFKILMIAASVVLFISTLSVIIINMKYTLPDKQLLSKASPEMIETEKYYLNAISEKLNILNKKRIMNIDLSSDLKEIDKNIKNISKDMAVKPVDERLTSAIINVYQTKLDLLDDLIAHTR